jgi:hypothetical protein
MTGFVDSDARSLKSFKSYELNKKLKYGTNIISDLLYYIEPLLILYVLTK